MKSRAAKHHTLECALLLALYLLATLFRASLAINHPAYLPNDPTGYYPAEAALQYRWAHDLVIRGTLPAVDRRVQWPEGLHFGTDITPVMEHIAAWLFRALPWRSVPFFEFSLIFIAAVSSLTLVLAYLAVRLLGGTVAAATASAFLAGFHPWGLERVVRNFGRENFALVFVFAPVVLVLWLWRKKRWAISSHVVILSVAAVSQAMAFASWHMARPLFELHAILLLLVATFLGTYPSQLRLTAAWVFSTAPFWVLLPVLQVRLYAFTPNIVMLVVLALGLTFARTRAMQTGIWGIAAGLRVLAASWAPASDPHVSSVLAAKLCHFLAKPLNPSVLAPQARLMWIEAFNSPRAGAIVWQAFPVLMAVCLLALMAPLRIAGRLRCDAAWRGFGVLLFAYAWAYFTFERLVVLFGFAVSVAFGLIASEALKGRWRWGAAAMVFAVSLFVAAQSSAFSPLRQVESWLRAMLDPAEENLFQNRLNDTRDILRWLRANTRQDDVIAAWFGLSSQIYAYADRPVVVQSKFENNTVQTKVIELAQALYGNPEKLAAFCRKYGARYFVYEAPMVLHRGTESYRYIAAQSALSSTCTVALLHFQPHELAEFQLVYQNRGFRVFRLRQKDEPASPPPSYGWFPLYDRQWCGIAMDSPVVDDHKLEQAVRRALALESQLFLAQGLAAEGKMSQSLRILRELLRQEPRLWQAAVLMVRIYLRSGNFEAAKKACRLVETGYEKCPDIPAYLGDSKGSAVR